MAPNELESFIAEIEESEEIESLEATVNPDLELTNVLSQTPEDALRIVGLRSFQCRVLSGLVATRDRVAKALGVDCASIPKALESAQQNPGKPEIIPTDKSNAGFLESRFDAPDLKEILPLGRFYPKDGGPYCTAFVIAARSPIHGMNLSFHRMMHLEKNRFAVRVVKRHLHRIMNETQGDTQIAAFCGVHPAVLLAAAISASPDLDELAAASALMGGELSVVEIKPGLLVPAHSQIVMTGKFTGELVEEGPFVDLTGTYDNIRKQPVLEIESLWMRSNALYHTILPGGPEHKILMGLPREPSILQAARAVSPGVREVSLTSGGCSWLHAIISTNGLAPGQGVNVGLAALGAHASLKKVTIVDDDIDIHSAEDVEWAEATRMQPHRDITVIKGARGSTLDPSRNTHTETTSKWIVDATKPAGGNSHFERAEIQKKKN